MLLAVVPDRQCDDTGASCVDACEGQGAGSYQWCGRCDYFIECVAGEAYYTACPPGLVYDHSLARCEFESTTCACDEGNTVECEETTADYP